MRTMIAYPLKIFGIAILLCLMAPDFSHAGIIRVGPGMEIKSITKGIELAADGDEVRVSPGIYSEGNIIVDKSIKLIGENFPVVDGKDTTEVFTIVVDNVTIQGFKVVNVGTSYIEDRAGIRIKKSDHFVIRDNLLENTFFGIYLEHANSGIVINNKLLGQAKEEMSSGNAIHLWYCKHIEIIDNYASGHRDGIYFEFVDSSLIRNNVSEHNLRYGLHFMFSNDDDYFNNTFKHNGAGVAVMFSKKINMWENTFEHNWGRASYGLLLKEIYDARIERNVFNENTIGVYMEGSTRINFSNNDFESNGWAINISGGCLDNVFTKNNFVSNTFNLSVGGKMKSNNFNGNFWSDYNGYDLDYDGVGDVPFRPVKLFNFIVNNTPEAMILLRSLFIDLINLSEKVSPVFTPQHVSDEFPSMKRILNSK